MGAKFALGSSEQVENLVPKLVPDSTELSRTP